MLQYLTKFYENNLINQSIIFLVKERKIGAALLDVFAIIGLMVTGNNLLKKNRMIAYLLVRLCLKAKLKR